MTETVLSLVPIHQHPPKQTVLAVWRVARKQLHEMHAGVRDSNAKARLVSANLTAEQLYIYEWLNYIFTVMALPADTFARSVGCSKQTLKGWLGKKGHFPSYHKFLRLLDIYNMNFLDQRAAEYLHGTKIGQWKERYKPIYERMAEKAAKDKEKRDEEEFLRDASAGRG